MMGGELNLWLVFIGFRHQNLPLNLLEDLSGSLCRFYSKREESNNINKYPSIQVAASVCVSPPVESLEPCSCIKLSWQWQVAR
jgi:hypothetical protein